MPEYNNTVIQQLTKALQERTRAEQFGIAQQPRTAVALRRDSDAVERAVQKMLRGNRSYERRVRDLHVGTY